MGSERLNSIAVFASLPITIEFPATETPPALDVLFEVAVRQLLNTEDWEALEWICSHPRTPERLLLELARFAELRSVLGHRPGPAALLELLASDYEYDEAILTLAKRHYDNPAMSAAAFREALQCYRHHRSMLETLLYHQEPDNPKNSIVEEFCQEHADSANLLAIRDQLHRIAQAGSAAEAKEIEQLYESNDPKVWVALAANPHTPVDVLRRLSTASHTPHAQRIRHAALSNLKMKVPAER